MIHLLKLFVVAVWLQLQLASVEAQEFVPVIPPECQEKGYCDVDIPGYPEQVAEKIIEEDGLDKNSPGVVDVSKQSRRGDPDEEKLCASVSRTIIPKVAKGTDGQWNYILNTNSFQQGFIVDICTAANSACSPVIHINTGYTASCQQNFITRKMEALDDQGQKTEKSFKIPTNCYCQVKQSQE